MILTYLLFATGLLGLFFGGEYLVRGASSIARTYRISPMVIGLTIVGFGTSAPELLVSVLAALAGQPAIAIGNVLGSNIANILLILGLSAVIAPLIIPVRKLWRDLGFMLLATAVIWAMLPDGDITRSFVDVTDCNRRSILPNGGQLRGGYSSAVNVARRDTAVIVGAYDLTLQDTQLANQCLAVWVDDERGNVSSIVEVPLPRSSAARAPVAADFSAVLQGTTSIRASATPVDPNRDYVGAFLVYLARDVILERPIAIKLLAPAIAARSDVQRRFLREARIAAQCFHPNIVPIHGVEETGDLAWIVMAYVPGETLADRLRRAGPLPADAIRRIGREVGWALSYAHERGVVHRDVKPENILLEQGTDRALIADFGIAFHDSEMSSGEVAGTARYMAPEQARGEAVDGRADLYALGVTLHLAATGHYPFEGGSALAIIAQQAVARAPAVRLRAPQLPSALTRNFGTTNRLMPLTPSGAPVTRASTRCTMFSAMSCSP